MAQGLPSLLSNFLTRKRLLGAREECRALAPICTALEINSHKNALQLCGKLLKKQPDYYVVSALKTVALAQTSTPLAPTVMSEILSTVEFLKTHANGAGLGDPDVIMFVGWVLENIGKGDEMLGILAKATQRHPDKEEVFLEAFQHYCRVNERKSAQQISMKMQRTFKSEKYLWWSVMTMLLQVRDINNPTNDLLLSLAERQISSHYTSLALAAGLSITAPNSTATGQLEIEGAPSTTESKLSTEGDLVKAPGRDKGKGKATSDSTSSTRTSTPDSSTPKSATPIVRTLEFDSAHEFHLVTRFLELRVLQAEHKTPSSSLTVVPAPPASANRNPSQSQAILIPSIPYSEVPLSLQQTLLAHFASKEADKWCERGLGFEIWRRECELRHGTLGRGDWERGWERLLKGLETGDTNWHTMLYLIRLTFSIASGSSKAYSDPHELEVRPFPGPSAAGETLLQTSRALFRRLADDGEKGQKERGFLLGLLEIARECRVRGWEETDPLLVLVDEYFGRFATKMCCFDDLRPYLEVLSSTERASLAAKMDLLLTESGDLSLPQIQRVISAAKISRCVYVVSDEASETELADRFLSRYFAALPLGKGLPVTELQPADDFALLAGEALVSAFKHSGERSHLEKAILILEFATQRSKYKYQIRILLINLARLLGAASFASTHYRLLDTKSIQYDTLSHLVVDRASTFSVSFGNATGNGNTVEKTVVDHANTANRWYVSGEHEATEVCVRAFSFHNYSNIEDFTVFQGRLQFSLSKFVTKIEIIRMKVLGGALDPLAFKEATEQLVTLASHKDVIYSDNRDYETLPNLQSLGTPSIWEQTSMGPRIGSSWLRAFVAVYSHFLVPSLPTLEVEGLLSSELTASEAALLRLSAHARASLAAPWDDHEADERTLAFFGEQERQFVLSDDTTVLPWQLLYIASVTFEGYCLLDLAVETRIEELTASKVVDHAKTAKRLRTLRTSSKELMRSFGSKVTAYGKQVAKQRNKTGAGLVGLGKFPLFDEDHISAFAHNLVESRRSLAEGLAAAIHRRTSK